MRRSPALRKGRRQRLSGLRDLSGEIRYLSRPSSALSSAVEHHLDMVVVSGSIPLARTIPLVRCVYACNYSSGRKPETV
jgi:hypothetical protein